MSESKYREWILDTIDSLRSRKARPDLERICRMVRRRHGSEPERTCAELEKLIVEQTVLKVNYKGSISYRNAAKVQRRSRKKYDASLATAVRSSAAEDASHSDLSNGDSAMGPADPDEDELEADTSIAMDTDSNADEEGADESRDEEAEPSPSLPQEDSAPSTADSGPVRAASAPCSPSVTRPDSGCRSGSASGSDCGPGSSPDCGSLQKAGERPNSLFPSSPGALAHNELAYGSTVGPAESQLPGMQRDNNVHPVESTKPAVHCVSPTPCALNNIKKEDGAKLEDISRSSSDQLVPDYAARQDETKSVCDAGSESLRCLPDNCSLKKISLPSFKATEGSPLNGGKDEVSVKKEKMSQNLLQWTVADVASYFSAAGFPEQAVAFRTQEIDGKSLLLMQRSDVLTGLSIRLGPALKIYERHVKVLQRTHFLECEDL
ncbi:sterile alpha motif domain containing 1a [Gouania willdenowi]|uniref:Atherin-like n=1 Tax=Gouania willdenowi TaxID=441366 RepID=A0A8C5EP23_GOUWI|nr:atherin-like [Gouania willdenowi]